MAEATTTTTRTFAEETDQETMAIVNAATSSIQRMPFAQVAVARIVFVFCLFVCFCFLFVCFVFIKKR